MTYTRNFRIKKIILASIIIFSAGAFSNPIDWNGTFGVDSSLIDNFRKIKNAEDNSDSNVLTQEVPLAQGRHANASFQSYVFKLNPVMIINDSATFTGEMTTGYGSGGRLGDDSIQSKDTSFGNALYHHNTSGENTGVLFPKLYMILYADTATYFIGRHTKHWGLGAVMNEGKNPWDRFSSIRDGVTMELKIGSFKIAPYWAKVGSENSLTRATKIKEYGASLSYDNTERGMGFGIHYSKKQNDQNATSIKTDVNNTGTAYGFGQTNMKLLDLFFKKTFGDFHFGLEFPIISGEIGNIYLNDKNTNYKARAILIESHFELSDSWKIGLDMGHVSGDSGSGSSFEAMFLHPNYQVANLMFRYNMAAVSNTNLNIYDSYITNSKYAKLYANYESGKWNWSTAFIYALANETAKAGESAYNHTTNKKSTTFATGDQSDKLGYEIDLGIDYNWNTNVNIGSSFGYHFVGDYFAYRGTADKNKTNNSMIIQARASIDF